VSAIQRFKRRCLDLDGNTNLKSKAGHYGNDSSIVSSAVRFAERNCQAEKFNEFLTPLLTPTLGYVSCLEGTRFPRNYLRCRLALRTQFRRYRLPAWRSIERRHGQRPECHVYSAPRRRCQPSVHDSSWTAAPCLFVCIALAVSVRSNAAGRPEPANLLDSPC
jgi:hypothetical protein